jgi:hypothetical protein
MKNDHEHGEDLKNLKMKFEAARADLERRRVEIEAGRLEAAHTELTLSIRQELGSLILRSPIPKGHRQERMRVINDLPNHRIDIQVCRENDDRNLTLSWATGKYVTALCNRRLVGALETDFKVNKLAIVSVATREMFVSQCMKALGCTEFKEAA